MPKYFSQWVAVIFGCLLPTFLFALDGIEELSLTHISKAIYENAQDQNVDSLIHTYLSTHTDAKDSLVCYQELGNTYRNAGNIDRAIYFLDLATDSNYDISLEVGKAYLAKALLYRAIAENLSAQQNYEAAIELFLEIGEKGNLLSACYQNLGKIYHRQGAYEKANTLFHNDLALGLSAEDSIRDYIELGNIWALGVEKAIDYYEKALAFDNIPEIHKGTIYLNLGELYAFEIDNPEKASFYIEKALPIFETLYEQDPGSGNVNFFEAFRTLGDIHLAADEFADAETAYNDALEFGLAAYGTYHRREIGKLFIQKGNLALHENKYEMGLSHFQQALKCVIPSFNPKDSFLQPNPEDFYTENVIVEALVGKGQAFRGLFDKNGDKKHLEDALIAYELVNHIGQLFRHSYSYQSAKLTLAQEHHLWNEQAVKVAYDLFQLTHNKQYVSQAFSFSERSKAWVLLELIKDATVKAELGLPAALLEKEASLKQEIMSYEEQMKAFSEQTEFVTAVKGERFRVQNELDALIASLETQYPKYYAAKYEFGDVKIPQIQQSLLDTSQTLIEYFWGQKEDVFAFVIGQHKVEMVHLGKVQDLEKEVENFYKVLQQPKAIEAYQTSAYGLYQALLAPLKSKLGRLSERLVIIPDGPLGYLPFDALLEEEVREGIRLKQMPYILKNHSISYAYSGSLLKEIYQKKNTTSAKSFLGISPEFKGSENYKYLPYSVAEIEHIKNTLGRGELMVRDQATRSKFIDQASEFGILHISSHAAVDDEDPMASWIAFWENSPTENNLLSVRDLFGMSLNASLAVLGACQTGYGDIHHGEGIMSLARGFIYAGCKSLVTTLWEANHWSTHQIMEYFYIHLKENLHKDEALRRAKLSYLNSEEVDQSAAHPYYWAAATPIGDMEQLDLRESFDGRKIFFLLLILGLAFAGWLGLKWGRI